MRGQLIELARVLLLLLCGFAAGAQFAHGLVKEKKPCMEKNNARHRHL